MRPCREWLPLCFALACWMLSSAACQKVELPAAEEGERTAAGEPSSGDGDGPPVTVPDGYVDAMTVAEVQSAYSYVTASDKELCAVIGYIVGYADRSMKNARFTAEGAVESNVLIADHRNETRPERCLPVQLPKGNFIRDELNLAGNPDVLGARIYISGYISDYYSTVGMRDPQVFEWVADDGDEPEGEEPVAPPVPEKETKDTLTIDDGAAVIPGGRSVAPPAGAGKPRK